MFNTKKKNDTVNTSIINTIIGDKSKIEGVLHASESTRVDGLLQGKILSESSVIIGENGLIRGDIHAVEILVAGTVYGNLTAKERIEITEAGTILGDLVTKTLVIDEGASFKGNCTMEVMEEKSSGASGISLPEQPLEEESQADQPSAKKKAMEEAAVSADNKKK